MRITARTDKGKVRSENQDDYRASIQEKGCAWAVVCDGMGGASGGSTASALAVSLIEEHCMQLRLCEKSPADLVELAMQLVEDANRRVFHAAQQDRSLQGMGTTMIFTALTGRMCCIASVGDSRAYLYREGVLCQLTKVQSMVQELVDKGVLSQQEAEHHPRKNVITRAVGIQPDIEADILQLELLEGDILLLCSDGLSNALSSSDIEGILRAETFYDTAEHLVDEVLKLDEQDNTTVVLISMV